MSASRKRSSGSRDRSVSSLVERDFKIGVMMLHPEARLPERAHPGDGGADLFALESARIDPGDRCDIGTGIALAIPPGYAGFVQPRSGLAFKHGIMLVNSPGLIDSGYRGEVRVCLLNSGRVEFVVEPGNRIAQLVIQSVETPEFQRRESLKKTERGGGGFGSSGR